MAVHILVVGAGAVGGFYASRFDAESAHVSLVCRSNYDAVREGGLQLRTHSFGDYTFRPREVYASIDAAGGAPHAWDYVVVATKALSTDGGAAEFVRPVVRDSTALVLVQNGVDVERPFRAAFPHTPIISAVTVISAALEGPATVTQFRWTRISFGPYVEDLRGGAETDAARTLLARGEEGARTMAELLTRGGIKDAEVYDALHLQMVRWHKLCINASMNVSGVLAGGRGNADMVRDPVLRAHIEACMHEVLEAAPRVFGRALPDKLATPEAILRSTESNTGSLSSMVQDWLAGRPLELEAILGNAVRLGEAHDAPMPRLHAMYALLQSAQAQRAREH